MLSSHPYKDVHPLATRALAAEPLTVRRIRHVIPAALRSVPAGSVDVITPVTIDGLSYVAADDPALPMNGIIPGSAPSRAI
ncbi:hypothetical protein A5757_04390 [Mycobacterium sp. 852013-51886_SCH5428379]|nr:hypothetical protein A5757_04390 [Mycobacterium sp. 852013-51886_SCH5428379]